MVWLAELGGVWLMELEGEDVDVEMDVKAGELLDSRLEKASDHVFVPSVDAADVGELDTDGVLGIDGMGDVGSDTDGVSGESLAGMLMSSPGGGDMS